MYYVLFYSLNIICKDVQLAMGVGKFGRRWKKVAEFMGSGLTGPMCCERWKSQLDPVAVAKKKPKLWTAEMVCPYVLLVCPYVLFFLLVV